MRNSILNDALGQILQNIAAAAQLVGRRPEDICLIGASKAQRVDVMRHAIQAGLLDFGENYAQELRTKQAALREEVPDVADRIRWHFLGRLQRRKIRHLVGSVTLIHSVADLDSAQEIDRHATEQQIIQDCLVQVNVGAESSKAGIAPESLETLLADLQALTHLRCTGLMTLPPLHEDPAAMRPYFHTLCELRDEMNSRAVYKEALTELSMGMSHDYEIAIEEGATMVRIGTALFGERE